MSILELFLWKEIGGNDLSQFANGSKIRIDGHSAVVVDTTNTQSGPVLTTSLTFGGRREQFTSLLSASGMEYSGTRVRRGLFS
jgi:hypothetical protein